MIPVASNRLRRHNGTDSKVDTLKTCPLCDTSYPNHLTACPTDGARLIESRDLEPGVVVCNKYRIERVLGRGGMGTVYLAEHILLDQLRALKFMSPELSRDAKFLKRFRLEAMAATKLRHPNIAEVVDLDQAEDGSPFIAMEYVEGHSLRDALADAPFPVERALAIARGVGLGLTKAHAKKIIHRDIKPENILLAQEAGEPEVPKILDFGIAAMKESSTAISRTQGIMLTPDYAAPEQWKGMASQELDGRVDLYALGGVLHEMLTGSTSFHAHNTEGWMYQHLQVTPEAPSRLRPELAQWKGLDELVLRLLEKDRDKRTASAEELVRELDAVRSGASFAPGDRKTVLESAAATPKVAPQPTAASDAQPAAAPPYQHTETAHRQLPTPDLVSFQPPPEPQPSSPAPEAQLEEVKSTPPLKELLVAAAIVVAIGLAVFAAWYFFVSSARPTQPDQTSERSQQEGSPSTTAPQDKSPPSPQIATADPTKTRIDPSTGLMWSLKDNGKAIASNEALNYCKSSRLSGYSDWRLPASTELHSIRDRVLAQDEERLLSVDDPTIKRKYIALSGLRVWSRDGDIYDFSSGGGLTPGSELQPGSLARALCVRGSASSVGPATPQTSATKPYIVQVAEFVQQADAQALVRALQMKGYTASLTRRVWNGDSPNSWAFFVKVGPFSDLKDAEAMRARLVADGYNPIMKRD